MKSGAYLELRVEGIERPPESVISATRPYGWFVQGDRLVYPLTGMEFDNSNIIFKTLEALNRASYVLKVLRMPYRIRIQGRSRTSQIA
ncbi:MAG: hypothetical protein ACE5IJ_02345 [Thermoplasmata archaeon]